MKKRETHLYIQARMGSTRLPKKVLKKISGKSIIEIIAERLKLVERADKIILVTSNQHKNMCLISEARRLGLDYFAGSEENLLDRFVQAGKLYNSDVIVRITGDCPLIDSKIINQGLKIFDSKKHEIVTNSYTRTYPDGLDFEIFSRQALERSWQKHRKKIAANQFDTAFINPTSDLMETGKRSDILNHTNYSHIRVTIDYPEDFEVVKEVYQNLYNVNKNFGLAEIIDFYHQNKKLFSRNQQYNQYSNRI